jgi:hypothetical protein
LYCTGTGISAICLRKFPVRRFEKIIGAAGSANFGRLVKYRQIFCIISAKSGMRTGKSLPGAPEFDRAPAAPEENNAWFVSCPHYLFMIEFVPAFRASPGYMERAQSSLPISSMKSKNKRKRDS